MIIWLILQFEKINKTEMTFINYFFIFNFIPLVAEAYTAERAHYCSIYLFIISYIVHL